MPVQLYAANGRKGVFTGAAIFVSMSSNRPYVTVVGNCQAESLRKLLHSTALIESWRIPPVHEATATDVAELATQLAHTDVLVTQPIRSDYRGLPLGTAQLSELLPPHARTIVVPVLRFDGLMPYQAIIRDPDEPSLNPPVVPYHDLRILCAAARGLSQPVSIQPSDAALRRLAAMSVEQMRRREQAYGAVAMSSHLETTPLWHTINHPDNATLVELARRVAAEFLDAAEVHAPDYEMLGETDAPIEPAAATALGVSVAGRNEWTFRGQVIPAEEIVEQHMQFYRDRPRLVAAGLSRHADRIEVLGLMH